MPALLTGFTGTCGSRWYRARWCSHPPALHLTFTRLVQLPPAGELFAECPIPLDRPLVTAIEPAIDSSRYFVLRIEDAASKRHAFIGLGFRERGHASDFNAALYEHLQYVKR